MLAFTPYIRPQGPRPSANENTCPPPNYISSQWIEMADFFRDEIYEWEGRSFYEEVKEDNIYLKFGQLKDSNNFFFGQTDRKTDRPTDSQTDRPKDRPTERQTDRQTDQQTDRQTLWFKGKLHFRKQSDQPLLSPLSYLRKSTKQVHKFALRYNFW